MKSLFDRLTPSGLAPQHAREGVKGLARAGAATIIERARECVGVAFRPQGRDPGFGLDCVGLTVAALGCEAPGAYAMRSGDAAAAAAMIAAAGLTRVDDAVPGDLLMFRSGPGQLHLGILSDRGIIHADGATRRVVERPGPAPWPVIGAWRQTDRES